MAKLLGTAPNQVPTNADLGDLAYVDKDKIPTVNVGDGTLVTEDGKVGIGTTDPTNSLHISGFGSVADAGYLTFERSNNDLNKKKWVIGSTGGVSTGHLRFASVLDSHTQSAPAYETQDVLTLNRNGNVGFGTTEPTSLLDVNDDSIRVRTAKTPSSASDTGTTGQIAWDADYIYVCTATDTWKRVAIATW
jgi:hypothetical protein